MSAFYDSYDYSAYWQGREYEHQAEIIAISEFLKKIKHINRAIEIGGGFGRLLPFYVYRTKTSFLTEPSSKLLALAKKNNKNFKNVKYLQSTLDNLGKRVRKNSFDLVLMIRVMHHMGNPDKTFAEISNLISSDGYLILEFANKIHFKNVVEHVIKKDFTFWGDTTTIDVRSKKSKRNKTIAFLNYHPNVIKEKLKENNFEIIEIRSVSNIRSSWAKTHLPRTFLLEIEKLLQIPFSYFYFGPSIFVLAKKKG
ncbi:MAG TPA: methyltransferase domain-containing protein [Patescibacteria group bacterium]|nr:methyltransferase domain-containing protein [Patescibacteria group bacterium]